MNYRHQLWTLKEPNPPPTPDEWLVAKGMKVQSNPGVVWGGGCEFTVEQPPPPQADCGWQGYLRKGHTNVPSRPRKMGPY